MAIPRLNSCCCGCSLKTGSQIMGTLEAVFVSVTLIASIVICSYLRNPLNFPDLDEKDRSMLYGLYITVAIITSFQILFSILMLIGISTETPRLMKPWLIFAFINLIELIVVISLNSIVYSGSGNNGSLIGNVLSATLIIGFKLYFILVVYNHYSDLNATPMFNQPILARNV